VKKGGRIKKKETEGKESPIGEVQPRSENVGPSQEERKTETMPPE
jgi:hypothetical protein